MPIHDVRRQIIQAAITASNGEIENVVTQLWQPLAFQLISIIGEGGFNSLYVRSFYLTQTAFPWLASKNVPYTTEVRFTELKNHLDGESVTEARKANHMLILTFTDILASLIGEPLTISILNSAWGGDAKDFPHE